MASMKDTLSKYFRIHAQGGGNPMQSVGSEGVRRGGYNLGGGVEARIPIDPLMKDALLNLEAGGYTYGGNVELPQYMQDQGAPAGIEYGDTAINNLGVGLSNGGFNVGANYNPQTNEKSVKARYKFDF
jgi:hypothetical protein